MSQNEIKNKRVICFVDGFNLYHGIEDMIQKTQRHDLKWLDLIKLANIFIRNNETLTETFYFSAYADWRKDSISRHVAYVKALSAIGVKFVRGKFKKRSIQCKKCLTKWDTHEEKQTDVNLSVYVVQAAYEDRFDRALIVTADTDIIPAIKMVRANFPKKEITLVVPDSRSRYIGELRSEVNNVVIVDSRHLANSRLRDEINCPPKYKKSTP